MPPFSLCPTGNTRSDNPIPGIGLVCGGSQSATPCSLARWVCTASIAVRARSGVVAPEIAAQTFGSR